MVKEDLKSHILKSISSWIALGELPKDGRLSPLKTIASILDVSVVTVREAVIALQTLGIVDMRHGKGVYVISPETVLDDMFRTRRELECLMARNAAAVIDADGVDRMHAHVSAMQTAAEAGDIAVYGQHDGPFHRVMFEASGLRIMGTIVDFLKSGVFTPDSYVHDEIANNPLYLVESNKTHWAIFEAMASHDAVRADVAVHAHLDRVYPIWSRNLDSMRLKVKSELAQIR